MDPNQTGRFRMSDIRAELEEERARRRMSAIATLIFMGFLVVCLLLLVACEG